jgi:hypothetical protein
MPCIYKEIRSTAHLAHPQVAGDAILQYILDLGQQLVKTLDAMVHSVQVSIDVHGLCGEGGGEWGGAMTPPPASCFFAPAS